MGKLNKRNNKFSKALFEGEISDIKPIGNTGFSKVFIKIMYDKGNRNGSYFDKEMVINKMIPTLYNVPITGHYLEDKDNFGGHDSKLEISSSEGIKLIDMTMPFGVVPESSDVEWDIIIGTNDGLSHDYITCDGILWYARYQQQLDKLLELGMGISMEVEIIDGKNELDGLFHVYDAEFSSLTILGKSEDKKDTVEPCFHDSSIEKYSFNKEQFKQEFSLMLKEIKSSLNPKLENNISDFDLNNNKIEQEKEDEFNMSKEEIAKNEDEFKAKDTVKPEVKTAVEDTKTEKGDTTKEKEKIAKEKADAKAKADEKIKADKEAKCTLEDSKKYELEISELKETIANQVTEIESLKTDFAKKIATKETELTTVKTDLDSTKLEYVEITKKFTALEEVAKTKDTEIGSLKTENEKLNTFKLNQAKDEIIKKANVIFTENADLLSTEEIATFTKKLDECKDFKVFETEIQSFLFIKAKEKIKNSNQDMNFSHVQNVNKPNNSQNNDKNRWAVYSKEYNK